MTSIAVVDFGMGNLRSVAKALEHVAPKASVRIATTAAEIDAADRVVFPGQGAMRDCMRQLDDAGLRDAVMRAAASRPLFGVCVGEQMLFDHSEEGDTPGLGILPGRVIRFPLKLVDESGARLKVPHIGWNAVWQVGDTGAPHPVWAGVPDGAWFYFVHSYHVVPDDPCVRAGESVYGSRFCCVVAKDNLFATQFHPEKSAASGLKLYENFVRWNP